MWASAADFHGLVHKAHATSHTLVPLDAALVPRPELPYYDPHAVASPMPSFQVRGALRAPARGGQTLGAPPRPPLPLLLYIQPAHAVLSQSPAPHGGRAQALALTPTVTPGSAKTKEERKREIMERLAQVSAGKEFGLKRVEAVEKLEKVKWAKQSAPPAAVMPPLVGGGP